MEIIIFIWITANTAAVIKYFKLNHLVNTFNNNETTQTRKIITVHDYNIIIYIYIVYARFGLLSFSRYSKDT